MSTTELKERLIEKIRDTENERVLEEGYRLLETEPEKLEVYVLSANQKKAVSEAREQIGHGKFLTDTAANKEIDKWLKKK